MKKTAQAVAVFILAVLMVLPVMRTVNLSAGKPVTIDRTLYADGAPLPPPLPPQPKPPSMKASTLVADGAPLPPPLPPQPKPPSMKANTLVADGAPLPPPLPPQPKPPQRAFLA